MASPVVTPLQKQTISAQPADWSQTLSFDQFDPSLGDLRAIAEGLSVDVSGGVSLRNLEAVPASLSATLSGTATISGPDSGWMPTAMAFARDQAMLAPGERASLTMSGSGSETFENHADGMSSGLIGTGSVELTLADTTGLYVVGPANLSVESHAASGAGVTLQYEYDPPPPPPPPTGNGLFGSGGGQLFTANPPLIFFQGPWRPDPSVITTQSFGFADRTTGWTDSVPIGRFEPSLGTLESVALSVTVDLHASVSAQNGGSAPAPVSTSQWATLALGTYLRATAAASDSMTLAAGGSETDADLGGTAGDSTTLADPQWLSDFIGPGTYQVPLSVTGLGSLSGPGNMSAELLAQAGATVTVSYRYLPVGVTADSVAWGNTAGGNWDDGSNWGEWVPPPQATDDVAITAPGTYTIVLDSAQTIHSLVMDAPGATLVLDADLLASGNIILDAGTIEFAGGKLSADHFTLNGGLVHGHDVLIEGKNGIAINQGSVVGDTVTLIDHTTAAGPVGEPGGVPAVPPGQVVTLANLSDALHIRPQVPGGDLLPPLPGHDAGSPPLDIGSGSTLSGWIHDHPGMLPGILAINGQQSS